MKMVVRNSISGLAKGIAALTLVYAFVNSAQAATLKIIEGPTSMKTAIDMEKQQAIVNFEYEGCKEPDVKNILSDTRCVPGECYSRTPRTKAQYEACFKNPQQGRLGLFKGSTGEVTFRYNDKIMVDCAIWSNNF